jgi:hypothetical protein
MRGSSRSTRSGDGLAADGRRLVVVRGFDFIGIAGLPSETQAILVL